MAEIPEEWYSNSNDAIRVSLVAPSSEGVKSLHSYNPKFTYSIFGDAEQIFGYKGLKVSLKYNSSDMRPHLSIAYDRKTKPIGDEEPTDIKAILEDFLPKTAFEKTKDFETAISSSANRDWTPPGELWQTVEADGNTYEIWKGNLSEPAIQQLVKRIQIAVPFFIEGGTLIDFEDAEWSLDRWTVFFLYQKKSDTSLPASSYTFMGYCTVFRYSYFPRKVLPKPAKNQSQTNGQDFNLTAPDVDLDLSPCRSRISQFIILPPFQAGGNGSRFYNSIFDYYLQNSPTVEITVEDPNEAFDDMRDLNDLARLRKEPAFQAIKINSSAQISRKGPAPQNIVDLTALENVRIDKKIAPRQFHRVTEMHLLSRIPLGVRQTLIDQRPTATGAELKAQQHEYTLWKLLVKQRLYRHNKDSLAQLERAERIERLEQALGGVEADYARLLRAFESRGKKKVPGENGSGEGSSSSLALPVGSKRPSAAPESDDEDDEDEQPSGKRIRFS